LLEGTFEEELVEGNNAIFTSTNQNYETMQ
jgi:hypothetical protein